MSARTTAARSFWWVVLESVGASGVSLLAVVLLARLLAPADFGVAAMALGIVQLLGVVVEMMFHDALVQRAEVEDAHFDTVFWATSGLGVLLALGCALAAPAIGALFAEPRVGPVLAWAALGLVFTGLNAVQLAQLRRALQFRPLALRTLLGRLLGTAVGVGMALRGYGPWALVGQYLVAGLLSSVVLWGRAQRWPALRCSPRHLRQLAGFAAPSLANHLLFSSNIRIFTLVAGYLLGATALGYFNLAFRVLDLLGTVLSAAASQLALPLFARRQADRAALIRAYRIGTEFTCLIALPACGGLLVTAHEVVAVVFGPAWLPAAPVIQVLAAAGMAGFIRQIAPIMLSAVGRPQANLLGSLAAFVASLVALPLLGFMGVLGAAFAWSVRCFASMPVGARQLRRAVGMSFRQQVEAAGVPLAATLAMMATVLLLRLELTAGWPPRLALPVLAAAGAGAYAAALLAIRARSLLQLGSFLVAGLRRGAALPGPQA
jgi:PST family polysaccharide transporter